MNHLREAAQQALEALEKTHTQPGCEQWQAERKASVALRAALAHQEQEPVARVIDDETPEGSTEWIPYSGRQVPVKTGDLLYAHPPRREWRNLTMQEIGDVFHAARNAKLGANQDNSRPRLAVVEIARAVEAALKEKNNG